MIGIGKLKIRSRTVERCVHGFAEVTVGENFLKDLKPHKLTAGVAARNLVIKEGDGQTAVGKVLENDDEEHRGVSSGRTAPQSRFR